MTDKLKITYRFDTSDDDANAAKAHVRGAMSHFMMHSANSEWDIKKWSPELWDEFCDHAFLVSMMHVAQWAIVRKEQIDEGCSDLIEQTWNEDEKK